MMTYLGRSWGGTLLLLLAAEIAIGEDSQAPAKLASFNTKDPWADFSPDEIAEIASRTPKLMLVRTLWRCFLVVAVLGRIPVQVPHSGSPPDSPRTYGGPPLP